MVDKVVTNKVNNKDLKYQKEGGGMTIERKYSHTCLPAITMEENRCRKCFPRVSKHERKHVNTRKQSSLRCGHRIDSLTAF